MAPPSPAESARDAAPPLHRLLAAAFLLATAVARPAGAEPSAEPPGLEPAATCALCAGELPVPVVPLSPAWLDSLARSHSDYNVAQIARIDSLLRAGHFGTPGSPNAKRQAHLLARLTLVNAYRDLVRLACDSTCVHEADEATFRDLDKRYSDVSLFPAVRLKRVRLGLGHVCMRYAVEEKGEGEAIQGGTHLRWSIKDTEVAGAKRRVLSIDLPTGLDVVVEVLLAPHHSFDVQYLRVDGPPAPYEWFVVHDIRGGWLRKWGTHAPQAYMFWVSAFPAAVETLSAAAETLSAAGVDPPATAPAPPVKLPATPLVGVRIYIPGLRLKLPIFIPDINFDDLREIELPQPILDMEYLRQRRQPAWLGTAPGLGFRDWKGYGPVPPGVRERFPDR